MTQKKFFMHHKNRKFNKRKKPPIKTRKKNSLSNERKLFDKYKKDLGEDYLLNDIIELAYPKIQTTIDILVSSKPSDVLKDLHIFLLDTINTGLNQKAILCSFLGIEDDDFIIDELYLLIKEGLIDLDDENNYRLTTKGQLFLENQKFIPETSNEEFVFYVDGLTKEITTEKVSKTFCQNKLTNLVNVNHEFIQENWFNINSIFSKVNKEEKEIIELSNYKRSIVKKPYVVYEKIYAVIYYPKEEAGKKIQIKAYNKSLSLLKKTTNSLNEQFSKNPFLFDFSDEGEILNEFKDIIEKSKDLNLKKDRLTGNYKDISTFEHKELISDALLTATSKVYIESPWIRRATSNYIKAMEVFLNRENTKLFIAYGIDSSFRNMPHEGTFEKIKNLQARFPEKLKIYHLPTHFESKFSDRSGTHRKILIKDNEFYIKGSFNWLSYAGEKGRNYAVEEGTQFFDNVEIFWKKIFQEYQLDL